MKRKGILAIVTIVLTGAILTACNAGDILSLFDNKPAETGFNYSDVDYYGCPNSKRVKKLNLKKNRL